LLDSRTYWLGVNIGIDRAYQSTGVGHYNEIRWLPVDGELMPEEKWNTSQSYRAIDVFGNGVSLRHPNLTHWLPAETAEPWLIVPIGSTSVTRRLSAMIMATCTSRLDVNDPRHLTYIPPPYDPLNFSWTSSPSPTKQTPPPPSPSSTFSSTLSPSRSPSSDSPVVIEPSPLPHPPPPISSPSLLLAPSPKPSPTPLPIPTPTTVPFPTLLWPIPSPTPTPITITPVTHQESSSTVAPSPTKQQDIKKSTTDEPSQSTWIIILVSIVLTLILCFVGAIVFIICRRGSGYAKGLAFTAIPGIRSSGTSIDDEDAFVGAYGKHDDYHDAVQLSPFGESENSVEEVSIPNANKKKNVADFSASGSGSISETEQRSSSGEQNDGVDARRMLSVSLGPNGPTI